MSRQNKPGALAITGDEPQREVTIEPAVHPKGDRGTCSCCHGRAPTGVRAYVPRPADEPFDAEEYAHVFYCMTCATRIGAAVAGFISQGDTVPAPPPSS